MSLAWSPYLWKGLHASDMVAMPLAWSPCRWHSLHAFGMVSMPLVQSLCLWHGHHAFDMIYMPLTWSPCLWHGLHACSTSSFFWHFFHYFWLSNFATAKPRIIQTVRKDAHVSNLLPHSIAEAAYSFLHLPDFPMHKKWKLEFIWISQKLKSFFNLFLLACPN